MMNVSGSNDVLTNARTAIDEALTLLQNLLEKKRNEIKFDGIAWAKVDLEAGINRHVDITITNERDMYSLIKGGIDSWNTSAYIVRPFTGDFKVKFNAIDSEIFTYIGLSVNPIAHVGQVGFSGYSIGDIKYGFYLTSTVLYHDETQPCTENLINTNLSYTADDVFTIQRRGSIITFMMNDNILTSVNCDDTLYLKVATYIQTKGVKNLTVD